MAKMSSLRKTVAISSAFTTRSVSSLRTRLSMLPRQRLELLSVFTAPKWRPAVSATSDTHAAASLESGARARPARAAERLGTDVLSANLLGADLLPDQGHGI